MKDHEFSELLAELKARIAINDARLMANPKPYLEAMVKRCTELLEVLNEVEYALSPDAVFDCWDENADKAVFSSPIDIQGEAYIRCTKALKALQKYRYGVRNRGVK